MYAAFKRACRHHPDAFTPKAPLMLDVGANTGSYSMMALSMGCRVKLVEPQPNCVSNIRALIHIMGAESRAEVINAIVGDTGKMVTVPLLPDGTCAGGFKANPSDPSGGVASKDVARVTVPSIKLDDIIDDAPVAVVKVDVEGFERAVVKTGLESFRKQLVGMMAIEVSPVFWRQNGWKREDISKPFLELIDAGYVVREIPNGQATERQLYRGALQRMLELEPFEQGDLVFELP